MDSRQPHIRILPIIICLLLILGPPLHSVCQTSDSTSFRTEPSTFIMIEGGLWNTTPFSLDNLTTLLPYDWVYHPSGEIYFGKDFSSHFQIGAGLITTSTSISYRDSTRDPSNNNSSSVSETFTLRTFNGAGVLLGLHQDFKAFRIGASLHTGIGINGKRQQTCILQNTYYYSQVALHTQNYSESRTGSFAFAAFTSLNTEAGYNFRKLTFFGNIGVACWLVRPHDDAIPGLIKTQLDPFYRIGIEYRL